jgi:nitrite reductase (NADH) large subunit
VVVIGNGMAGVAVVEELLAVYGSGDAGQSGPFGQAGQDGQAAAPGRRPSITIFGDEPHVNYNRILLSELLAGRRPVESIYLNRRDWYTEQGIDLRMGVKVASIDPARRCVIDATGAVTPYDQLVIAVGATPFIPPIAGVEKSGVFVFRTIHDTDTIAARARECRNAVVIGGGLLGLEAARALLHYGVAVTVVHLMDRLMEQQLDAIGGAMLKREIERLGMTVRLNSPTAELCGAESVEAVRLASDERLPAELVVICAGIRPDLRLAQAAGLATKRGLLVDDQLRTSAPEIYAVGDVIEHRGRCYGLVAPLREQARVAARAITRDLAGQPSGPPPVYEGTLCMTALKVAGVHLTSAGRFLGGAGCEELAAADTFAGRYRKLVFEGGRLVGMILLGDTRDGSRLFGLIQSGADVASMKEELMGAQALGQAAGSVLAMPSALADMELVCNCHGVTRGAVVTAIRDKGLKSRDEIAHCTKASTGCGSCAQQLDDLLLETARKAPALLKSGPQPVASKAGSVQPAQNAPPPMAKPLTGYPLAYPRALEVERIKREGLGLDFDKIHERGVLALTEDDFYRLKTYGVCSQKHPGYFMVRIRIPGGRVTARQLLALADLAETHGRGWGHLTTRQNLELHWVRLEEILTIWERLEAVGLSTRSACGHTMRNVMACPHGPISPEALIDAGPWASAISDYFVKRSDLINPAMPNRLNIYFAGCPDCATHAQINDIGFAAIHAPRSVADTPETGFALWVGGSLGAHPMVGFKLREFLTPEEVLPACQAIFELHTQYGNRSKAKSRLKWLIDQWGIEKFSMLFDQRFEAKRTLPENRTFRIPSADEGAARPFSVTRLRAAVMRPMLSLPGALPQGCLPQRQTGYVRMAVAVPLGEIRSAQLTALAGIARRYGNGEVYLTKDQDVELHWVEARRAGRAARALERAGLSPRGHRTDLRVVACPGTEFCVLAVTNAQGAARELLKRIRPREAGAAELLRGVSIAVSGCPNSCAKHQIADIGLAGTMTMLGEERRYSYLLYLGGRLPAGQAGIDGTVRLGEVVRKGITEEMVAPTVEALLEVTAGLRLPGESFQQTIDRVGPGRIGELLEARLSPLLPDVVEKVSMALELDEVET